MSFHPCPPRLANEKEGGASQAPEVCCGQPYGTSADVWSAGIIFLHLLALKMPSLQSLFKGIIPDLQHLAIPFGLSFPETQACLRSMLQLEPATRPSSGQIVQLLVQAVSRLSEEVSPQSRPSESTLCLGADSEDSSFVVTLESPAAEFSSHDVAISGQQFFVGESVATPRDKEIKGCVCCMQ